MVFLTNKLFLRFGKRGKWIFEKEWKYKRGGTNSKHKELFGTEWRTEIRYKCSACNKVTMVDSSIFYKYCPHCGSENGGNTDEID